MDRWKRSVDVARVVELAPNERYAFVAKSRAGKSLFAMLVVCRIIPDDPRLAQGWQCWWVDTKGDRRDQERLYKWKFHDFKDRHGTTRRLIKVPFEKNNPKSTVEAVNDICYKALARGGVLLVIDEYRHVCPSTRTASPGLLHVFQRGGGLDVGVIGQTQEPVDVPRQLISQASHIILGNVSYPHDITYCKNIFPGYHPPLRRYKDKYGFYWGWIDGDGEWEYHPHQLHWDQTREDLMKAQASS
jgi:hypothetical protein